MTKLILLGFPLKFLCKMKIDIVAGILFYMYIRFIRKLVILHQIHTETVVILLYL